ncbi:lasso peptide biosynthesis PqqD family chaperone [Bacillus sp. PS06]|uniref:lasso peptide biosynthesis PqqD family chaperone n=1 Tax=Bacillus sp. PS06 TaxID=2764176 RepID=UPI0017847330|nr:lasso peptide biosynthesis PqqD family chaperone [Bacillus sp. PS06]MBD8071111.1 lasso peptide biosynthesis PqqD family chaperone [Bacillus sp. PS06]
MIDNKVVSLTSIVEKTEGNIVCDMNGEKVMLSIENGKYYNFGKVGGDIWVYINSVRTVSDITQFLQDDYEIDQEQCEQQVLNFIESLYKENLVVLK